MFVKNLLKMVGPSLHTKATQVENSLVLLSDNPGEKIANKIENYFISDFPFLLEALRILSIPDVRTLFTSIETFFVENVKTNSYSIAEIENLNLKNIAYEFLNYLNIPKPLKVNSYQKKLLIEMMGKLGRVFLHEIVFPELNQINPRIAMSLKQSLKRNINSIAIIEGFDRNKALQLLMIEELDVSMQVGFFPEGNINKVNIIQIGNYNHRKIYFDCALSEKQVDKLADILKSEYEAIRIKKQFTDLLLPRGREIDTLLVYSNKVKLMTRIFFCLSKLDIAGRKALRMNTGKGLWKYLQQNIIDDSGNIIKRELRKISNEINNNPTDNSSIIKDADDILNQIIKK